MNADVKGALEQINTSWSAFTHKGLRMTKIEVRIVLEYALSRGYKTTADLKDEEVDRVLTKLHERQGKAVGYERANQEWKDKIKGLEEQYWDKIPSQEEISEIQKRTGLTDDEVCWIRDLGMFQAFESLLEDKP